MRFFAPKFIDDTITVTGTVVGIRQYKGIVTLDPICTNQDGEVTPTMKLKRDIIAANDPDIPQKSYETKL